MVRALGLEPRTNALKGDAITSTLCITVHPDALISLVVLDVYEGYVGIKRCTELHVKQYPFRIPRPFPMLLEAFKNGTQSTACIGRF
jgi:hypothetical protein